MITGPQERASPLSRNFAMLVVPNRKEASEGPTEAPPLFCLLSELS